MSCNSYHKKFLFVVLLLCGIHGISAQSPDPGTCFIEAEDFQFRGGWELNTDETGTASGKKILAVKSGKEPAADAMTVIRIKQAGLYFVWTRSRDYAENRPGTRRYRVLVNESPMELESGAHLKEGYYWERTGKVLLQAGENLLQLKDTRNQFARCDALLLTIHQDLDPNTIDLIHLQNYRSKPEKMATAFSAEPFAPPITISKNSTVVATIANDKVRLNILQVNTKTGKQLVMQTSIRNGRDWAQLDAGIEDNRVFLLRSANPKMTTDNYFPAWNGSLNTTRFTTNGKTYSVLEPEHAKNPFFSGYLLPCSIQDVQMISDRQLKLVYKAGKIGRAHV